MLSEPGRLFWLRPMTCYDWCRAAHVMQTHLKAFGLVSSGSSYRPLWAVSYPHLTLPTILRLSASVVLLANKRT